MRTGMPTMEAYRYIHAYHANDGQLREHPVSVIQSVCLLEAQQDNQEGAPWM